MAEWLDNRNAAQRLGITQGRLTRWHFFGWVTADGSETVTVPGVGPVSARRWSSQLIEDTLPRVASFATLEAQLR